MLILARRIGESIMVGDQVEISVVDIKGDQVKLGIKAPSQVKVYRREVYAAIQQENLAAAAAAPQALPMLEELMGTEGRKAAAPPPASPDGPSTAGPEQQQAGPKPPAK
jgi:carbon storage regulator